MKKNYLIQRWILAVLLLISCSSVFAQRDVEFWFAVPKISHINGWGGPLDLPIYLRMTSYDLNADVIVSAPALGSTFPTQYIHIPAGTTVSINLTGNVNDLECTPADATLKKGIHITSTQPISAYYELANNVNSEIWTLKGKNALGTNFYIPTQNFLSNWAGTAWSGTTYYPTLATNTFDIVATKDNTHLTITPSHDVQGHPALTPYPVTLNKGETYSAKDLYLTADKKLDGSTITSDSLVAITVTDDLMNDSTTGGDYWGHAYDAGGDQIIPYDKIGTDYIAVRGGLNTNHGEKLFVLTTAPGTQITQDDGTTWTSVPGVGTTYQVNLTGVSTYIRSNNLIYLSQMSGMAAETGWDVLPPVLCNGSTSVAYVRTPSNSGAGVNFLLSTNGGQNSFSYTMFDASGTIVGSPNTPGLPGISSSTLASMFSIVPGRPASTLWVAAKVDVTMGLLSGYSIIVKNSTPFNMGVVTGNGGETGLFGYFSNFGSFDEIPTASNPCLGDTLHLFSDTLVGSRYTWEGPGGFTSSSHDTFVYPFTAADTGIYRLTVVDSITGCTSFDSVHVGLNPNCCVKPHAQISIHGDTSGIVLCVGTRDSIMVSGGVYGKFYLDGQIDSAQIFVVDSAIAHGGFPTELLTDSDVGVHTVCFIAYASYPDSSSVICADTVCINFTVVKCCTKPVAFIKPHDTVMCVGSVVNWYGVGGAYGQWFVDDTSQSNGRIIPTPGSLNLNHVLTIGDTGLHHICYVAYNDTLNLRCADTTCSYLRVNAVPVAHISLPDSTPCVGDSIVWLYVSGGPYFQIFVDSITSNSNTGILSMDSFPGGMIPLPGPKDDSSLGKHILWVVIYSDTTSGACTDTASTTGVVQDCGCQATRGTSFLIISNDGLNYSLHDSFTSIQPNFINWIIDDSTVGQTAATDTFRLLLGPGHHKICMQTATVLIGPKGDNICCYNTVCNDSIYIDACAIWKATDTVIYQLSPTNIDSVTFTFHGSRDPLVPTLVWNFGDGTSLVGEDTIVTHYYNTHGADTGIYHVCVDVVWSRGDTAAAFDSTGVCCCVDKICLNVDVTPCSLPSFFITVDSLKGGYYDFVLGHTTSFTNITSSSWSVTYPSGALDSLGSGYTPIISPNFYPKVTGAYFVCVAYEYQVIYNDELPLTCSGYLCDTVYMKGDKPGAMFKTYPNPTTGQMIVEITNYQNAQSAKIEIADMQGQPVMSKTINGLGAGITQNAMDIGGLPQGVYIIKMNIGGVQQINKLIKE